MKHSERIRNKTSQYQKLHEDFRKYIHKTHPELDYNLGSALEVIREFQDSFEMQIRTIEGRTSSI
jgi:hypothetical protein